MQYHFQEGRTDWNQSVLLFPLYVKANLVKFQMQKGKKKQPWIVAFLFKSYKVKIKMIYKKICLFGILKNSRIKRTLNRRYSICRTFLSYSTWVTLTVQIDVFHFTDFFFFFWWDLIVLCLSAGVALFMAGPSGPVILWSWTHCICKRSPHRHSWFGREVCVLCSWSECLCPLTFILFCILWHIHVQNLLCCGGHNLHVNLLENECRALQ